MCYLIIVVLYFEAWPSLRGVRATGWREDEEWGLFDA